MSSPSRRGVRAYLAQVAIGAVAVGAVVPLLVAFPFDVWVRITLPVVIGVLILAVISERTDRRQLFPVGCVIVLVLALALDGGVEGVVGAIGGWRRFLTQALPFPDEPAFRSVATVLVFAAAVPGLWANQLRYRATGVILAPVVVFGLAFGFTRPQPLPAGLASLFPVAVLVLLAIRSWADLDDVEDLSESGKGVRITRQIGFTALAIIPIMAVSLVLTLGYFSFVGGSSAINPRDQVEPVEDPTSLPNPLELASVWRFEASERTEPCVDDSCRIAQFDFAEPVASTTEGPIRLAVLDVAEPEGFTSSGTFSGSTGELPVPTGPDIGAEREVDVVVFPSGSPWLPTVGAPVGVAGFSAPAFNPDTSTIVTGSPADGSPATGTVTYLQQPVDPVAFRDAPVDLALVDEAVASTGAACPAVDAPEAARQLSSVLVGETGLPPVAAGERMQENLLTLRPFDPSAPGGTQRSEAIVNDFASNADAIEGGTPPWPLETTVAAAALTFLCAENLPARVAVGLLDFESDPDGTVNLDYGNITAWVEVPVEGAGWVPIRLEPRPEEIQARNETVSRIRSNPDSAPPRPIDEEPLVEFVPQPVGEGRPILRRFGFLLAGALTAVVAWALVAWLVRRSTIARRRSATPAAAAVRGAWTTQRELLATRGVDVEGLTVRDLVMVVDAVVGARSAVAVARALPAFDRALYSDQDCTAEDADRAWQAVDVSSGETRGTGRLSSLRHWMAHPGTMVAAWAQARSVPKGAVAFGRKGTANDRSGQSIGGLADLTFESESVIRSIGQAIGPDGRPRSVFILNDVPVDALDDPELAQRIRLAASIGARRGVLRIGRDTSVSDSGSVCLLGDPLPGPSLARLVAGGEGFPAERVASLLDSLASTLSGIHIQGIVHGAIEPDNIWLDPAGAPVLGPVAVTPSLVGLGRRPFVSVWSAPEVLQGDPVSVQSDVFQLGMIGRLLLGVQPIPPPRGLGDEHTLPDHPLLRATDAVPSRRWRNVEQFVDAIAQSGLVGAEG